MAIEAVPVSEAHRGQPRVRIVCDDCGKDDVIACTYIKPRGPGGKRLPDEGKARGKAVSMGWSFVKNTLRCPACEQKRKVVPVKKPEAQPPAEPTKRQRIEIFAMLAEVYDIDEGRYRQGDTDETVADVLNVMPGWVAQIREAEFGPDGTNDNIEDLSERIDAMQSDIKALLDSASQQHEAASKKLAQVSAMRAELDRIKTAVGPRVLRKAGVQG